MKEKPSWTKEDEALFKMGNVYQWANIEKEEPKEEKKDEKK